MSLLVWLPLHGNLNNYGLSEAKFRLVNSSGGLATTTAGKTAQAAYYRKTANTADYITSDINFTLSGDFSMCCWCKLTGYGTTDSANGIITQHGHTTGGSGITMHYVGASDYRMSINTGINSGDRTYTTYYGSTNIYNDWHHLCVTYDRSASKYRMYVDGKAETIVGYGDSVTYGDTAAARPFRLFDWSTDHSSNASYRPPCYLNDVRLYDHCLSAKEVKQISQGLIAHYKLSAGGTNNLLTNTSNPTGTSGLAGVPSTCSVVYDNVLETNVFQSRTTATGETYIYSSRTPVISPSTVYTFSCDIYVNDLVNSIETFWLSDTADSVKTGTGYVNITNKGQTILARNKWFHLTWTFTTKANDRTGYIRIDNNGSSTSGSAAIMKVTNLKLEKGPETPYVPIASEAAFTIGDDCSGFGNHGTATGTIELNESAGRNERSATFTGSQYIACGRGPMVRDALTVNWWGYMDDWTLYGSTPMRALSCTDGGGWNFEPSGSKMNFACGTGASSNTYKSATSPTTFANYSAGWHMFTGTYDGYNAKIYIDGKLEKTNAAYTTKTPIYYNASNGIFIGAEAAGSATTPDATYFTGKISDVRIYATALSDEDIATLYKTAGSVTKDGTLLAYAFHEDDNHVATIQKQGNFIANSYSERGMLNDVKFTVLSDGSAWGRIFYHNNKSGTVLFTSYDEVMKTDTANKFSCMYLLDQLKATDGKYEFMLTYPSYSTAQMNRWKQSANPCSEYKGTSDSSLTATGYEAITINYNTNYWGGLTRQNSDATTITPCYLSGSVGHSNWFHAVGAAEAWDGAIPGPNVAVQETELWVRLDTLPLNTKMSILGEKSVIAFNLLEI